MTPVEYALEIEASLNHIYESHDTLFDSIMNSDNYESFYFALTESENEKSDNILVRLLKAISSFLNGIINKFREIITGSSLRKGAENEKIQVAKDPNLVIKFLNGDLKDSKEFLQKAQRGEVSVDEARAFVNKQNGLWESIKSCALPAVAIFGGAAANEMFIKKWKSEADQVMSDVQRSDGVDYAGKMANTLDEKGKKTIANEASKVIISHMNDSSKNMATSLLNPIKELFQKQYIQKKLRDDSVQRNDPNYARRTARNAKAASKEADKQAKQLYKDKETRDKSSGAYQQSLKNQYSDQQTVNKAIRDTFDDTKDVYVDEESIKDRKFFKRKEATEKGRNQIKSLFSKGGNQ